MKHNSDKKHHSDEIVDAILSDDGASIARLGNSGSVGTWSRIIDAARDDSHELGAEVAESVVAKLQNLPIPQTSLSATKFSPVRVIGGLSAIAAAVLFVLSAVSNQTAPPNNEPFEVAVHTAVVPLSVAPATEESLVSLTSTTINPGERGVVFLSNSNNSESIRISHAVRLEAVNGSLRIGSL